MRSMKEGDLNACEAGVREDGTLVSGAAEARMLYRSLNVYRWPVNILMDTQMDTRGVRKI